ncbi:MAG: R3H domain-containing nucleic acid-binding protein [Candidatus Paceibacterota bacterium]
MPTDDTNQQIQRIIEGFLSALSVSYSDITMHDHETRPVFMISAENDKELIGSDGTHLQAINTLVHQIARKQLGPDVAVFSIDVNYHREHAREALTQKASACAERARSLKNSIAMEPMSSFERFVVHDVLSNVSDIETCSEGVGEKRHVVITYTDEPEPSVN